MTKIQNPTRRACALSQQEPVYDLEVRLRRINSLAQRRRLRRVKAAELFVKTLPNDLNLMNS